jgi:hypothetical protein
MNTELLFFSALVCLSRLSQCHAPGVCGAGQGFGAETIHPAYMYEGGGRGGRERRARILLHIQLEGTVLRWSRAGQRFRFGCRN